jgi:FlaA1/EpsC-like NDP-sugar epimerase
LRPNLVEFSCIWILYGCLDAWPIKFSFCCYFVIGHGDLHQHLDFIFVVILLSMMIIYTGTLIFFLFILCYRSWRFTPAPWFVLVLLSIMVIYASALISFLLLFCYRSWLFTPGPWFSFCCYFVIDHGDLHQHLDFVFYFVIDHGNEIKAQA